MGATLVGGALLSACSSSSAPSNPNNPSPSDLAAQATLDAMPVPFSTPKAEAVPAAAAPLGAGDYGIEGSEGGSIKGTLASKELSCDPNGFLHVDTDEGSYMAGVVSAADWNCERALSEWRKDNSSTAIGLRYTPTADMSTIVIVNDAGKSMTLRVSGAWKVS